MQELPPAALGPVLGVGFPQLPGLSRLVPEARGPQESVWCRKRPAGGEGQSQSARQFRANHKGKE